MKKKKDKKKIMLGPVITIIILTIILMFLSTIFSMLEVQGQKNSNCEWNIRIIFSNCPEYFYN